MQHSWFLLKHRLFWGNGTTDPNPPHPVMLNDVIFRNTLFWNDLCRHKSENVSPAIWSGNGNILMNKVKTFSLLLLKKKYNEQLLIHYVLFFLAFFSVSDWFCSGVLFEASCLLYDSNIPYLEFGLKCQLSLLNYPLAQLVTKGI